MTNADKAELVLNENIACNSCCTSDKLIYISKILIMKNNKTEDIKYAYNYISPIYQIWREYENMYLTLKHYQYMFVYFCTLFSHNTIVAELFEKTVSLTTTFLFK